MNEVKTPKPITSAMMMTSVGINALGRLRPTLKGRRPGCPGSGGGKVTPAVPSVDHLAVLTQLTERRLSSRRWHPGQTGSGHHRPSL
jgi:hypothetical protein